jgi:uncharacterized protein YoxC
MIISSTMTNTEILQMLTGPFSAMLLAVIMLVALGRWLATNIPIYLERHLKQIDKMVESHNEDREMYREGLQTLTEQHNLLARDVQDIKADVKAIHAKVG